MGHKRTISNVRLQQSQIPPPPQNSFSSASPSPSFGPLFLQNTSSESNEISNEINKIQHYLQLNKNNHSLSENTRLPELSEMNEGYDECQNEQMALKQQREECVVSDSIQKSDDIIIEIQKRKKSSRSKLNHLEDKNAVNDLFWNKYRKIPFIALAMMMSTFLILIFIHFTNLYKLLFGGLVPCGISLAILLPIYCFFKKYDMSLKYKSLCIQSHIEKSEELKDEKTKLFKKNKDL